MNIENIDGGKGTNSRAELMGVWATITFVTHFLGLFLSIFLLGASFSILTWLVVLFAIC